MAKKRKSDEGFLNDIFDSLDGRILNTKKIRKELYKKGKAKKICGKGHIMDEKSRRYWYGSPEERVHFNEGGQTVNRKGEVILP